MNRILICDDEKDIVSALKIYLSSEGFETVEASSGKEALEILQHTEVDLVLMDIMMPGTDGLTATVELRKTSNVPVILLTAKSEESDMVQGLNLGADDYVTKPFGVMELISRVKALLRRSSAVVAESLVYSFDIIRLDDEKHMVFVKDEYVELTYKEYELLKLLLANAGIVTTRDRILERVWGTDFEGESRTLDMHVKTLRQKLKEGGTLIKTVRNVGYIMSKEV